MSQVEFFTFYFLKLIFLDKLTSFESDHEGSPLHFYLVTRDITYLTFRKENLQIVAVEPTNNYTFPTAITVKGPLNHLFLLVD